jgi:hypothetical protein
MGKLSRGISYQSNESLAIAKLYALIDTAIAAGDAFPGSPSIYDIVMGDLTTVRAIHTASSPASPATNDLAVGSDGLLDRYTGSAWVDLTEDVIYLVNNASFTLITGTPVIADAASAANCNLWNTAGICPEPLGLSMGVFPNGATAAIRIHGIGIARVNSPISVAVSDHLRIAAQGATALSSTSSVLTDVLAIVVQSDVDSPLSGNVLVALTR